jgi:plastocyanin
MPTRLKLKIIIIALCLAMPAAARAADAVFSVTDQKGKPVPDAVVFLTPKAGKAPVVKPGATAVMDQKNKEFVPHVLPVQAGTSVSFPNSDNIFHHVYSFSNAKQFELPLYKGKPASPIVFDKPGVVVLGCNIHDWMRAYIVVLETPYFSKTDKYGTALIAEEPPGEYSARVWHSDLKDAANPPVHDIKIGAGKNETFGLTLTLKSKKTGSSASDTMGIMQY